MRKILFAVIVFAAAIFTISRLSGTTTPVQAQMNPTGVQLVPFLSGLESPVFIGSARDGSNRLFVIEQPGRIRIVPAGGTSTLPTPFLDIVSKVSFGGERGLLGIAFHPQYRTNGRFFVNYTRRPDGATVVSEFRVSAGNANVADTTEKVIITIAQPFANHNGGWIDFGPDGFLYIAMGDGGSGDDPQNRSQNVEDLLGKMLRIDINTDGSAPYTSPSTNPFFGNVAGRDEIYSTGLRNPFRCSFDRQTGELYAGDVGQGVIEEVSILSLGGNFGWRVLEGTRCTNLGPGSCTNSIYIPPVVEYSHSGGRCSITGGYVYRGTRNTFPAGTYVYGDFCTGEIFTWSKGMARNAINVLTDSNLGISSFGEDEAGELYVVGLGGSIFKLVAPSAVTSVSAASYSSAQLAPNSIATAFGTGLAASTVAASTATLPTTLGGVTLQVRDSAGNERQAPLYFVSPNQINFLVPEGTANGTASIRLTNSLGAVGLGTMQIASIAPGFFSANGTGRGLASAVVLRVRANGSQVFEPVARFDTAQNQFVATPIDVSNAAEQVFLVPFGTGFRGRSGLAGVTATIGGTAAQVTFAGAQGQFFGLDQANIRLLPALAGRGDVDVLMTVDGQTTNLVRVNIR